MRAAWIAADGTAEVRRAATDWKDAGRIDAETLAAIEAEFPTSRVELARAWKVLVFALVTVAIFGVYFGVSGFAPTDSSRFFVYGAILAGVTELLRGSRLAGTGADAATSFWAVTSAVGGFAMLFDEVDPTLAAAAVLWGVACWRWGFALYAPFAAIAGFLLLARTPAGRLSWAVIGVAGCVLAERVSRSPRLSPARRRAFAGVFVVCALALYGAINVYSHDARLVERLSERGVAPTADAARPAFVVATAVVPIAFLAWGIRARRRLVLDTGALLGALSVLTLHYYERFGAIPITLFGLALIGVALWLNRRLRTAPGEEVRGFTVTPLSAEPEALAPAAALAAAAASPISQPHTDRDFEPGGGRYGGGGASGKF